MGIFRPVDSLRERKKQRTRLALEEAALDLFERKGFDATTIEEVAAAADVSPRTLFRYFATKRDLIFGDTERYLAQLLGLVRARPRAEAPLVALAAAFVELAPLMDSTLTARQMALARANPALRRHWAVTREAWADALAGELALRHGLQEPDPQLELAAGIGQRILGQAFVAWHAQVGSVPLVEVVRDQLHIASRLFRELATARS